MIRQRRLGLVATSRIMDRQSKEDEDGPIEDAHDRTGRGGDLSFFLSFLSIEFYAKSDQMRAQQNKIKRRPSCSNKLRFEEMNK